MSFEWNIFIFLVIPFHLLSCSFGKHLTIQEIDHYRNKLKSMFNYAYESYVSNADNFDELKPITCKGVETWGNFSLTLIDSMDSLILFQNYSEFERVSRYVIENVDFNQNINVSVFETNIRVVGGLLSAHLLSYKSGIKLEPGWPCEGPLLRLAVTVGRKLLPAFQTKTGMPYGTVNLRYGVPLGETPVTCTAGVGTFILEFATLSRLTGDPIFEKTALNALRALYSHRSHLDLVGNHINTENGRWTAIESSIGSGVDSYFEYLVKGGLLLKMPELMDMFNVYHEAINKHMKRDDWYFVVHMKNGLTTMPVFQSLESFFPGLLTIIGDIEQAQKSLLNYRYVLKRYGFIPEFFDVANNNIKRNGNPLRPEFSESLFYLYKATKDPFLLTIGAEVIEAIEYSAKTDCGYATIKNVYDHTIEDRMESFFLAETLKYLYLLFDNNSFIHNEGSQGVIIDNGNKQCIIETGGYIFNTEAHPFDVAALDCCSTGPKDFVDIVDSLDVYSLLGLSDDDVSIYNRQPSKRSSKSTKSSILQTLDLESDIIIHPSSDSTYHANCADYIDPFTPNSESSNNTVFIPPSFTSRLNETTVQSSINISPSKTNKESANYLSTEKSTLEAVQFDPNKPLEFEWTPITDVPTTLCKDLLKGLGDTKVCDTPDRKAPPTLDEPEIITAMPSVQFHHFTEDIPSDLNLSDLILQYEDDEPLTSNKESESTASDGKIPLKVHTLDPNKPLELEWTPISVISDPIRSIFIDDEDDSLLPLSADGKNAHEEEFPSHQNTSTRLETSHETLLCSPTPFLINFSKYGQVLMRSKS